MHRLLIAAVTAAFVVVTAAPTLADEYPPCTRQLQDHCREVGHQSGEFPHHHHHPHH
jgi:hypothetical protein